MTLKNITINLNAFYRSPATDAHVFIDDLDLEGFMKQNSQERINIIIGYYTVDKKLRAIIPSIYKFKNILKGRKKHIYYQVEPILKYGIIGWGGTYNKATHTWLSKHKNIFSRLFIIGLTDTFSIQK